MKSGRFQNIINTEKPVLVDFYTDWCSPCKQMIPVLKELKEDLKESIRIIKVNVDKNPFIATTYNIRNIPTVILFKKGEVVWADTGLKTTSELKSALNGHI